MKTLQNQIQLKSSFVRILIGMMLLIFVRGTLAEDLLLSEAKNISNLGLARVSIQQPPVVDEIRSTDKQRSLDLNNIRTRTLTYSIDIKDCTLFKKNDGYDYLVINGLPLSTNPGLPQLPVKTLTAKLSKDAEILGIEVVSGSYRQILNPVNLANSPQPYVWMRQEDIPEQLRKRLKLASMNPTIHNLDSYFPGEIATYSAGRDNDSAYVYIRTFPVQYIPDNKKAILITNVKINVYYSLPALQAKAFENPRLVDSSECLIICPSELKPAAELLKDFHIEHENISTSIITTEDIDAAYFPAADPLYGGYGGDYAGKDKIVDYNYELARKIISYLRKQEVHPNLKYVTLFGDGQLVPPSYYLNEWAEYEWYDYESYYDWIPTDFFYTSPDYDFIPNFRVGRLPVSDARQAECVVSKITRWHNKLSWDWFKRVTVGGGRPFGTEWYYGELCSVDLINKDIFNGMELTKYYYTDGTFDVNHVKSLLIAEDTGLFYHVDHGSGHKLWIGDESIDSSDILSSYPYPRVRTFNSEAPIVVSISCINGAYDTDLTSFEDQPEFPLIPYPTSFGESVVLSDAGGIAYVGGSRLNYAGLSIFYDQGKFLANHYFMQQICGLVVESYHRGVNRIGNMTYDALRYYAQGNSMDSTTNRETIFGFILLGDPVLSVPTQQPGLSYQKPYLTAIEPDSYSSEGVPSYKDLPSDRSKTISVVTNSDSSTINVKSIYAWNDIVIARDSLNAPSLTHTFTPTDCGNYLIRSAAEDGKEGWLYLNAQFVFVPTSEVLLIDGDYGASYEGYYTDALDNLGHTYDIWENGARDFVDAETLAQYDIVIWTIPFSYPSACEKAACQIYLDNGGRLFITGQDIGYHLTSYGNKTDGFYNRYLHAQYVEDNANIYTLTGACREIL